MFTSFLSFGCASVDLAEARATSRIAETPPVDINAASCNGLSMKDCDDDISLQFDQVSEFWKNQCERWTQQGLQEEQAGQEIVLLGRKIAAMTAEASTYFHGADSNETEKIKAKFSHYMAVYTADRHRLSSLAVARLQEKNVSASEINARRSRMREAFRHIGNQQNQEIDVHVHQD
jgi:hypothetical protein